MRNGAVLVADKRDRFPMKTFRTLYRATCRVEPPGRSRAAIRLEWIGMIENSSTQPTTPKWYASSASAASANAVASINCRPWLTR